MKMFSDRALGHCGDMTRYVGGFGFLTAVGVGFVAWSATHLYMCFCAPAGFWGFVQSLVVMDSTFCQLLMGLIHHTQSIYGGLMLAFLFSVVAVVGKGVSWMTGKPQVAAPTVIEGRVLRSATAAQQAKGPIS